MDVEARKAAMRTEEYKKSIMYGASLVCLSIMREEGLITDEEEYRYYQQKVRDKYRSVPSGE